MFDRCADPRSGKYKHCLKLFKYDKTVKDKTVKDKTVKDKTVKDKTVKDKTVKTT